MLGLSQVLRKQLRFIDPLRQCHNIFGIRKLIAQEKPNNIKVSLVPLKRQIDVLNVVKEYFLPEHVLVKAHSMDFSGNQSLDEYIISILKQGNSLYATTEDDTIAGVCINYACCAVDPNILRKYASYRQDTNIKDFLHFSALIQEAPNLWKIFKQIKIFEISMLAILPEFRRQGLAVMLVEESKSIAQDQGYQVVRMNCINAHDYKIAERSGMDCVAKYPIHKLRSKTAPFIKKQSDFNAYLRVYVHFNMRNEEGHKQKDNLKEAVRMCEMNLVDLLE